MKKHKVGYWWATMCNGIMLFISYLMLVASKSIIELIISAIIFLLSILCIADNRNKYAIPEDVTLNIKHHKELLDKQRKLSIERRKRRFN